MTARFETADPSIIDAPLGESVEKELLGRTYRRGAVGTGSAPVGSDWSDDQLGGRHIIRKKYGALYLFMNVLRRTGCSRLYQSLRIIVRSSSYWYAEPLIG
jgi:hypothetical protein